MEVWSKFLPFLTLEESCSLPVTIETIYGGFNVQQKFPVILRQVSVL